MIGWQGWRDISTAPTDGTVVWVFTAAYEDLPAFQGPCAYHKDAGWCTDELREVTHWSPTITRKLKTGTGRPVFTSIQVPNPACPLCDGTGQHPHLLDSFSRGPKVDAEREAWAKSHPVKCTYCMSPPG